MNLCGGCREDFGSVSAFDRHRVGKHAFTFSEGFRMDPPREDGRRCLDTGELEQAGWHRDSRSRWRQPVRDREGLSEKYVTRLSASEGRGGPMDGIAEVLR
jgi:hypothetical protein